LLLVLLDMHLANLARSECRLTYVDLVLIYSTWSLGQLNMTLFWGQLGTTFN